MNQLGLGITIALRDMFSARARRVSRGFQSLDDTAYRAARGISHSAGMIEEQVFNIARTFAASAAIMGAVAWPTAKAMEFSTAIAEIATIADYANTNMEQVSRTLLEQAFRFPTTPVQQAEAAYEAVSSGFIKTQDALRVVEEATALAVTTRTETDKSLRALTGILNSYAPFFGGIENAALQASNVSDLLFETIRYGRIRMDELGKYVGYGASSAAIGGINMEDFLSATATMTLGSLSPEQAFQYLRQLIIGTLRPPVWAEKIGDEFGIDFGKDAIAAFGGDWTAWLLNAYDTIMSKGGDMADFARLLSGRQAFAGAATIINLRDTLADIKEGMQNNLVVDDFGVVMTSRQRALMIQSRELAYQLDRLTSGWVGVATVMGRTSERVLIPVVSALATMTGWVLTLVDKLPILSKVFMSLMTSVSLATAAFGIKQIIDLKNSKAMRKIAEAARLTTLRVFGVTLTLKNFVTTVTGSFLLLGGAFWLIRKAWEENWGGLYDKTQRFVVLMRSLWTAFTNLDGAWGTIPQHMYEQLQALGLVETFRTLFMLGYRIRAFFEGFGAGIKAFFVSAGVAIVDALEWAGDTVRDIFPGLAGFFDKAADWVANFSFNLSRIDVSQWRELGYTVGRVLAMIATFIALPWVARSGWLLVAGAFWTMMSPVLALYRVLRLAFWTLPIRSMGMWRMLGRQIGLSLPRRGTDDIYGDFADGRSASDRAGRARGSSGMFGWIMAGLSGLWNKIGILKTPLRWLGTAFMWLLKPIRWIFTAIVALVGILGGPLTAVIAAVAGIVALFAFNWDYVAKSMPKTAAIIRGAGWAIALPFILLKKLVYDLPHALGAAVTGWGQRVGPQVKAGALVVWNGIRTAFGEARDRIVGDLSSFWSSIMNTNFGRGMAVVWNGVRTAFSESWQRIKEDLGGVWAWISRVAGYIWSPIATAAETVFGKLKNLFEGFLDFISPVTTWIGEFVNEWITAFSDMWNFVADAARSAWNALRGKDEETASGAAEGSQANTSGYHQMLQNQAAQFRIQGFEIMNSMKDMDPSVMTGIQESRAIRSMNNWLGPVQAWLDSNKDVFEEGNLGNWIAVDAIASAVEKKVRELSGSLVEDGVPSNEALLDGMTPAEYFRHLENSVSQGAQAGVESGLRDSLSMVDNIFASDRFMKRWESTYLTGGSNANTRFTEELAEDRTRASGGRTLGDTLDAANRIIDATKRTLEEMKNRDSRPIRATLLIDGEEVAVRMRPHLDRQSREQNERNYGSYLGG